MPLSVKMDVGCKKWTWCKDVVMIFFALKSPCIDFEKKSMFAQL